MKNSEVMSTALTKESTNTEVKHYFQKIHQLHKSGKEFPINLEEVWPVAYGRKQEAVRVLKSDFVEGEDYVVKKSDNQFLRKNAQKHTPGRATEDYYLSTACLEYFIAKKVKRCLRFIGKYFTRPGKTITVS